MIRGSSVACVSLLGLVTHAPRTRTDMTNSLIHPPNIEAWLPRAEGHRPRASALYVGPRSKSAAPGPHRMTDRERAKLDEFFCRQGAVALGERRELEADVV